MITLGEMFAVSAGPSHHYKNANKTSNTKDIMWNYLDNPNACQSQNRFVYQRLCKLEAPKKSCKICRLRTMILKLENFPRLTKLMVTENNKQVHKEMTLQWNAIVHFLKRKSNAESENDFNPLELNTSGIETETGRLQLVELPDSATIVSGHSEMSESSLTGTSSSSSKDANGVVNISCITDMNKIEMVKVDLLKKFILNEQDLTEVVSNGFLRSITIEPTAKIAGICHVIGNNRIYHDFIRNSLEQESPVKLQKVIIKSDKLHNYCHNLSI